MTAITPQSKQLLDMVFTFKLAHDATGAMAYGPDLSAYPAWLYDAFITVEAAIRAADRATM